MFTGERPKQLFTFRMSHEGEYSFTFELPDGTTPLIIRQDGKFIVHGKVVEEDRAVYEGFCEWLDRALGDEFLLHKKEQPHLHLVREPKEKT